MNGMTQFATLVKELGSSTRTNDKLDALVTYFAGAAPHDKVWVIGLFSGRRPRRAVTSTLLALWCRELVGIPQWLYEECYHTAGDLAETIALLLPDQQGQPNPHSLAYYLERLVDLLQEPEAVKKAFILQSWKEQSRQEKFVFNKLITGGFRIGVSQQLMVQALAKTVDLDRAVIAHRISGRWDPLHTRFDELLGATGITDDASKPYPFFLSYALEQEPAALGHPAEWQAEWKWDGIRGQLIKREGQLFVWSRGEELMTDKFPEYAALAALLPDGVALDGEIMPSRDGKPLPFALLQTRIGRKNVTRKQLLEAPVAFFAYDLLEWQGEDQRNRFLSERRRILEELVATSGHPSLLLSPLIGFETWESLTTIRENSRDNGAEGLMLKRLASTYQVGRKRGDWWKWKIDPMTIDAVLVYAQKGHGRRSNLYTDYTFAVRDGEKLVTFTKAYSGLTDKEFAQVDAFVKRNSLEKFGPVRTVKPELVFEIAFEGIAASSRHKSGVALRFPRMSRWRTDKKVTDINTLDDLKKMLEQYGK